ncbi:MAG: hypothetical protein U1F57_06035 [bacterium]
MEKQNTSDEKKKETEKGIRNLQNALAQDVKLGRYYGLDQKIRKIQRAFSLSIRI